MKEEWIAWLMLLVIGGIGMIFLLSGAAVLALEKRKKGRCIAVTEGKIVKYNHRGQVPQPVVEYQVGGVLFRKTRRFRGVVTIQKSGLLNGFDGEGKVTIDEKDIVHIRRGAFLNWRNLVEAEHLPCTKVNMV